MSATAPPLSTAEADRLADRFESRTAEHVLAWAAERFGERAVLTCSWQKQSSVLVHMVAQVAPGMRVVELDTGVLFPETYETREKLIARYPVQFERILPELTLDEQAAKHGERLWERDPDACCGIRKVTPLKRALEDVDCWVAGVRRSQASSRRFSSKLAYDERHGLWKANPLADWTEREVWDYVMRHDVPYNPLHDRGYESIGCTHCTVPSSGRDGRWAELDKTECGLHG